VAELVADLGLVPRFAPDRRDLPAAGLRVTAGHYIVHLPDCPDWSKPTGPDYRNTVHSNFGCATISNLGLMVADPADLMRGQAIGPGDAEAAVKAIERYRKGEVKELPKDATSATSVNFK